LLNILESYFRNAAKYHPKPEDAGQTTYFSGVGANFIFESAKALFKLQPTSSLFSQHQNLLQSLGTSLQDLQDNLTVHPPPDYLFFASLLYVLWLLRLGSGAEIIKTDVGQSLILIVLQYRARVTQLRRDIEKGFYNALVYTFERDWPEFVKRAKEIGVFLPAPTVQLPIGPPLLEGSEIQEELRQPSGDVIVDARVDPLGERCLQEIISAHSLEMADDDATA